MLGDGEINENPMGNSVVHPNFRFRGKLLDFGHTMKGDNVVGHLSIANIQQSADFEGGKKVRKDDTFASSRVL